MASMNTAGENKVRQIRCDIHFLPIQCRCLSRAVVHQEGSFLSLRMRPPTYGRLECILQSFDACRLEKLRGQNKLNGRSTFATLYCGFFSKDVFSDMVCWSSVFFLPCRHAQTVAGFGVQYRTGLWWPIWGVETNQRNWTDLGGRLRAVASLIYFGKVRGE